MAKAGRQPKPFPEDVMLDLVKFLHGMTVAVPCALVIASVGREGALERVVNEFVEVNKKATKRQLSAKLPEIATKVSPTSRQFLLILSSFLRKENLATNTRDGLCGRKFSRLLDCQKTSPRRANPSLKVQTIRRTLHFLLLLLSTFHGNLTSVPHRR